MAWPNPLRRRTENTRHAWGYTFEWGSDHWTREEMHPMKYSYDVVADEALDVLDRISPSPPTPGDATRTSSKSEVESRPPKLERDVYALLKEHHERDPKLTRFWEQVGTVPDWVDWDQVARGQDVFYRYGGVALTALAFQSLLGGMGAGRVTEVLARTGGFSTKAARHRLYETTQHILQVTQSLAAIQPGGAGHVSSVRVRLLHAAVRRRILRLASQRPSYYSVEELGVPINDLDCIGTIGTFSAALIWIGLPRQGLYLRRAEIADYIALWRLVAWYVGTPTDVFATPAKAKAMMESLLITEVNPTETGRILAHNIILSLEGQAPTYVSRDFLLANARWLNGGDLADALGLGNPSLYYWALVAGQCIFFMAVCYTHRSVPSLDQKKIKSLRKLFYQFIVTNKTHGLGTESTFDFKHVPTLAMTSTEQGIYDARKQAKIRKTITTN